MRTWSYWEVLAPKGQCLRHLSRCDALRSRLDRDSARLVKNREYCRPEVSEFEAGERYILALKKITKIPDDGFNPSTPNVSFGRIGDYELSSCGGYWLIVKGLVPRATSYLACRAMRTTPNVTCACWPHHCLSERQRIC